MSAAKMVADSTISDLPLQTVGDRKRRKSSIKKRNKKQKKKTSKKHLRKKEDANDSDLDLTKDLESLGEYIGDRQELLNQLFHCVHGPSLERTLPDILKELSVADLKQRCLEQLEIMSKKRIRRILEGDDPADISSSGTEDYSTEGDNHDPQSDGATSDKDGDGLVADSTSLLSGTEDRSSASEYSDEEQKCAEKSIINEIEHAKTDHNQSDEEDDDDEDDDEEEEEEGELREEIHGVNGDLNSEINEAHKKTDTEANNPPVLTQNQMELLELEMRARAIKAMLKSQGAKTKNKAPTQKFVDIQSTVIQKSQEKNIKETDDTMNAENVETTKSNKITIGRENNATILNLHRKGQRGVGATTMKNVENKLWPRTPEVGNDLNKVLAPQAKNHSEKIESSRHRTFRDNQKGKYRSEKNSSANITMKRIMDHEAEKPLLSTIKLSKKEDRKQQKLGSGEDPAIVAMLHAKERAERERVGEHSDIQNMTKRKRFLVHKPVDENLLKKQKISKSSAKDKAKTVICDLAKEPDEVMIEEGEVTEQHEHSNENELSMLGNKLRDKCSNSSNILEDGTRNDKRIFKIINNDAEKSEDDEKNKAMVNFASHGTGCPAETGSKSPCQSEDGQSKRVKNDSQNFGEISEKSGAFLHIHVVSDNVGEIQKKETECLPSGYEIDRDQDQFDHPTSEELPNNENVKSNSIEKVTNQSEDTEIVNQTRLIRSRDREILYEKVGIQSCASKKQFEKKKVELHDDSESKDRSIQHNDVKTVERMKHCHFDDSDLKSKDGESQFHHSRNQRDEKSKVGERQSDRAEQKSESKDLNQHEEIFEDKENQSDRSKQKSESESRGSDPQDEKSADEKSQSDHSEESCESGSRGSDQQDGNSEDEDSQSDQAEKESESRSSDEQDGKSEDEDNESD